MFDISWGETVVIIGISVAAIGRKDLPKASKFLGNKVGKVVGLLQGARARADLFAQSNELNALQNELRSGLRELDTVKGELAVAASSQGLVGRGLGSIIPSSRRTLPAGGNGKVQSSTIGQNIANDPSSSLPQDITNGNRGRGGGKPISGNDYLAAAREASDSSEYIAPTNLGLAPRSQSVAAVAEEEWEKQGIGFKSRAERGTGFWQTPETASSSGEAIGGGSSLLADLIQQNLIHDQYDRAVMEQDQEIQDKMDRAKAKAEKKKKDS
jgi:Sec-independent protein translocase protein TatA